ncbi:ABC transporter permease [Chitinimonas koreensis]|uniref:ABC transporter permease n=1 Tax=Chitinimonas koreensis TaxID=356302 RepID=UPI0027E5911F|nr:ABC transporter permease [Chitinimonas koreensis]
MVSLLGLVAVIMAGLNERRRELSILRAIGAGPRQILLLLAAEGALVTVAGIVIGASACAFAILLLGIGRKRSSALRSGCSHTASRNGC